MGTIGKLITGRANPSEELLEDGVDPEAEGSRLLGGRSQEVGNAGDQADVGLWTHRTKTLGQDLSLGAGQQLGTHHQRSIATVGGVKMSFDVRIADHGEDLHFDALNDTCVSFLFDGF